MLAPGEDFDTPTRRHRVRWAYHSPQQDWFTGDSTHVSTGIGHVVPAGNDVADSP